ncbi:hypothetical protein ACPOL_6771 (plasmid) [Acidisarcina polymorpha]|uniref:Uncharacterized protein n=1 Tax=Acidisarcina polymorpha TaxID=2211140 RepID=A0A2Z5GA05_9BACT|nr:hypothetical protein [Acidisarcina polymorpha]AXC15981.1 hypothetical protein ACPOL_6771 [Acidisarcina polymorpha]
MKKPVTYVRIEPTPAQRVGKSVAIVIGFLFLAIAIESLFFTVPTAYHIFKASRKTHVRANSQSH